MYEKTDRLCPHCFRWLRLDRKQAKYFCPDTIQCQLRKAISRPPERVTLDMVRERLKTERSRPRNRQDVKLIVRLQEAIERWA